MNISQVPVALLAGGLATRLYPLTRSMPKILVEVAGRPFLDHLLELFARHGIRKVVLCLGQFAEQVQKFLDEKGSRGLEVQVSLDGSRLLGTGGALRQALPLLGEVFWALYGDSYLDFSYGEVLDYFLKSKALGLMTVYRNEHRFDRSNIVFQDGQLLRYDKKHSTPDMKHIDYGATLLRREVLETISPDQPVDLVDVYTPLISQGLMIGYQMGQRFYEIGSHAGLKETETILLRKAGLGIPGLSNHFD